MDGLNKDVEAKMDGLKKGVEDKMDCLKKGVEAKMNGMDAKMNGMDAKMNDMDDKREELKINLNRLLYEMVTNAERVVKETHDGNKRNVNHDFIDSNVGSKIQHIPKIDMRNLMARIPQHGYYKWSNFSISIM